MAPLAAALSPHWGASPLPRLQAEVRGQQDELGPRAEAPGPSETPALKPGVCRTTTPSMLCAAGEAELHVAPPGRAGPPQPHLLGQGAPAAQDMLEPAGEWWGGASGPGRGSHPGSFSPSPIPAPLSQQGSWARGRGPGHRQEEGAGGARAPGTRQWDRGCQEGLPDGHTPRSHGAASPCKPSSGHRVRAQGRVGGSCARAGQGSGWRAPEAVTLPGHQRAGEREAFPRPHLPRRHRSCRAPCQSWACSWQPGPDAGRLRAAHYLPDAEGTGRLPGECRAFLAGIAPRNPSVPGQPARGGCGKHGEAGITAGGSFAPSLGLTPEVLPVCRSVTISRGWART